MPWVGREFKDHLVLPLAMGRAATHQLRLPEPHPIWRSTPPGTGHSQLLWAAVPVPHCPLSKEFSPNI